MMQRHNSREPRATSMGKPPPTRPFIVAKAGSARRNLIKSMGVELSDVRVLVNMNSIFGQYNGTLYVGRGADKKLIKEAELRGFTIDRTYDPGGAD